MEFVNKNKRRKTKIYVHVYFKDVFTLIKHYHIGQKLKCNTVFIGKYKKVSNKNY